MLHSRQAVDCRKATACLMADRFEFGRFAMDSAIGALKTASGPSALRQNRVALRVGPGKGSKARLAVPGIQTGAGERPAWYIRRNVVPKSGLGRFARIISSLAVDPRIEGGSLPRISEGF